MGLVARGREEPWSESKRARPSLVASYGSLASRHARADRLPLHALSDAWLRASPCAGKVGGVQAETFVVAKKRQGNLANTAEADSRAMAFTDVQVGKAW